MPFSRGKPGLISERQITGKLKRVVFAKTKAPRILLSEISFEAAGDNRKTAGFCIHKIRTEDISEVEVRKYV